MQNVIWLVDKKWKLACLTPFILNKILLSLFSFCFRSYDLRLILLLIELNYNFFFQSPFLQCVQFYHFLEQPQQRLDHLSSIELVNGSLIILSAWVFIWIYIYIRWCCLYFFFLPFYQSSSICVCISKFVDSSNSFIYSSVFLSFQISCILFSVFWVHMIPKFSILLNSFSFC